MADRRSRKKPWNSWRGSTRQRLCNALEVLRPECRTADTPDARLRRQGPVLRLSWASPESAHPLPSAAARHRAGTRSWYEYVAAAELPTMVVIEDRDVEPGTGAFWGEVNSLVHKTLGSAGCVTNGSFRDVTALADGFQILGSHVGPSHAHVHIVEFGKPVDVCGILVHHDDIVHADYQGAVVIPADCVAGVAEAVALVSRREKVILDACRDRAFSFAKLQAAMARSKEIH